MKNLGSFNCSLECVSKIDIKVFFKVIVLVSLKMFKLNGRKRDEL